MARADGEELVKAAELFGDFRPIMRMYQPKPEVLARDYALRSIENVGEARLGQ